MNLPEYVVRNEDDFLHLVQRIVRNKLLEKRVRLTQSPDLHDYVKRAMYIHGEGVEEIDFYKGGDYACIFGLVLAAKEVLIFLGDEDAFYLTYALHHNFVEQYKNVADRFRNRVKTG